MAHRVNGGDRGVTPVIGIILLIAIAVVLAGVITVFIGDIEESGKKPSPNIETVESYDKRTSGNGHYFNITHQAGDNVDIDNLQIKVKDASSTNTSTGSTESVSYTGTAIADADANGDNDGVFDSSETIVIDKTDFTEASGGDGNTVIGSDEYLDLEDSEVLIIWESDTGDQSAIIFRCTPEGTTDCQKNA